MLLAETYIRTGAESVKLTTGRERCNITLRGAPQACQSTLTAIAEYTATREKAAWAGVLS
jgi:hypothetical protein